MKQVTGISVRMMAALYAIRKPLTQEIQHGRQPKHSTRKNIYAADM